VSKLVSKYRINSALNSDDNQAENWTWSPRGMIGRQAGWLAGCDLNGTFPVQLGYTVPSEIIVWCKW